MGIIEGEPPADTEKSQKLQEAQAEAPKQTPIVQADKAPPADLSWYQSPQAIAAVAAIGGGVAAFSSAFGIVIPFSALEITAGLGGVLSILGGGFALYRRIRAGLDPTSDASKLKLF